MKKFFKSKRRWIAFSLALVLIVSTCISSSDAFLWAFGGVDEASDEVSKEYVPAEAIETIHVVESESSDSTEETEINPDSTPDAGDTGEAGDVIQADAPEGTQGAAANAGETGTPDAADPEGTVTDQPDAEEQAPTEDIEVVDEENQYGYTIRYYYGSVEDEDARVENAGALGDPILTYVEGETVHNGKDYVLDRIENKDCVVSADAEKNVVKVYYVLKEAEEIAKPAQTLEVNADGVSVTISAGEGILPEGTAVEAEAVGAEEVQDAVNMALEAEGLRAVEINAVDITLKKGNTTVQPSGKVTVKLSDVLDDEIPGDVVKVYHVAGDSAKEVGSGDASGTDVEFSAEHFSVYAAVKAEKGAAANAVEEEKVTVKIEGVEGVETADILIGKIAERKPEYTGYDFVDARYANAAVDEIYAQENGENVTYFVSGASNALTAIQIGNTTDIILTYKPHVDHYTVTYNVKVDGKTPEETDSVVELIGVKDVDAGEDLEFSVKPRFGYDLESVTVKSGNKNVDGIEPVNGRYTVKASSIDGDVTVAVELNEKKEYSITFSGSNTTFEYDGKSYGTDNNDTPRSYTYKVTSALSFVLKPNMNNTGDTKALNKLAITLTGENDSKQTIAVTPPVGKGSVTTKQFDNGTNVQVTLKGTVKNDGCTGGEYEVVITGNEKLRGDIAVATNYKDANSSEIWPQDLIGVDPIGVVEVTEKVTGWWNQTTTKTEGTLKRLDPEKFEFTGRTTQNAYRVYIKVKDGYSKAKEDIKVSVTTDANPYGVEVQKSTRSGYDWYFEIPADGNGFTPKDIRISVTAKKIEKNFKVTYEYDNDGENSVTNERVYKTGDSFAVTDGMGEYPTKKGYVFQGWTIGTDEKVYKPGAIYTIDGDTEEYADGPDADGNYVYTFKAKWVEADEAEEFPFIVNVYFEENGSYSEEPTVFFEEFGPADQVAYIIPSKLQSMLEEKESELPNDWRNYIEDSEKTEKSKVISSDGTTVVNVYYKDIETNDVYTYVKFDGLDNDDVTQKAAVIEHFGLDEDAKWDGEWFPVGKIPDVEIEAAAEANQKADADKALSKWSKMTDIKAASEDKIDEIKARVGEWDLHTGSGANSFANVSGLCWHLDGTIDLNREVKVEYVDEDGKSIEPDSSIASAVFKTVHAGDAEQKKIDGYVFVKAYIGEASVSEKSIGFDDTVVTITLQYTKKMEDTSYMVRHVTVLNGEETVRDAQSYTNEAWVNDDPQMIIIEAGSLEEKEYTGYRYEGTYIGNDKQDANPSKVVTGTVITLKYVARNDLGYRVTYHYSNDGTSEVGTADGSGNNGTLGGDIPYDVENHKVYGGEKYIFDTRTGKGVQYGASNGKVSAVKDDNTVDVYYVLDSNGNEKPDYLERHVYYDGNGGTGTVEDAKGYLKGETVIAEANRFTYTGKEFAYWKWKSSEGDVVINAGDSFTMPDTDVTLTAQWRGLAINKSVVSELPEDQTAYAEGDQIDFEITITNTGDVTLNNVTVTDTLDGAVIDEGEGYVVENGVAKVASLAAGSEGVITVYAHYTVTANDLGNDEFKNTATATADDIKDPVPEETDPIPVEGVDEQLTITKTLVMDGEAPKGAHGSKDGKPAFTTGDTAEFLITVTNTGDKTLKGITLEEQLPGAKLEERNAVVNFFTGMKIFGGVRRENGVITIAELKPGQSKEFKAEYVIPEDRLETEFRNVVIAGKFEGTSDPIPVEDKRSAFDLEKTVSGTAKGEDGKYKEGDVLTYTITVDNRGNTALEKFEVTDRMTASGDIEKDITDRIVNPTVVITDKDGKEVETVNADLTWSNGKFTVSEIPFGNKAVISYTYTVIADDAGKTINNVAIAGIGDDKKEEKPENPVVVEKRELKTEKAITDIDGKAFDPNAEYKVGNVINFTVKVTNTGNVDLSDIVVTDTMTGNRKATLKEGESSTIASLAAGATAELHYSYTVAEGDLGAKISNKAWAESGNTKSEEYDTPEIKIEPAHRKVSIDKTITSTGSADGGMYKVGEAIKYRIAVKNIGNILVQNVVVKDEMDNASGEISNIKLNGVDASGIWNGKTFTIASIVPGEEAEITYDYVVQPDDRNKGKIDNRATVVNSDIEKDVLGNPDTADVEVRSLDVKKAVQGSPANRESYQLDEEVTFVVTVKNDGNVSLSDIIVTDEMQNAAGEAKYNAELTAADDRNMSSVGITEENGNVKIVKLNTNETVYLYYTYKVEAGDIGNTNMLYNKVTVDPKDEPKDHPKVDPKTDATTDPIPVAEIEPYYTVAKRITSTGSLNNGTIYAIGDFAEYEIQVTNTGNVDLTNVPVKDEMKNASGSITDIEGAAWNSENKTFTVSNIAIGETKTITYKYKIQKEDIGKEITNKAKAIGSGEETPDNPNPVKVEDRSLEVVKEVLDENGNAMSEEQLANARYKLNDVVEFKVTVTNTGNVTLNDVTVSDRMWAGKSEGAMEGGFRTAKLVSGSETFDLAVGSPVTLRYQYTITEGDLGYRLYNQAIAGGELSGENPKEADSDTAGPVIVEERDPKLSIVKTITSTPNTDTGMYKVGDTIIYQIEVKNEGNTTLKNVEVKDTMTGASGKIVATSVKGARYKGSSAVENGMEYTFEVSEIPVGGTGTITYIYRVVKDDIGKSIRNAAVAEGVENEKEPENPEPVVIENRKLEVTKRVVNEPADGEAYKLGETIQFEIIVKNAGNVDLTGIKLTDIMVGAAGNATVGTGQNTLDIPPLPAGEAYRTTNFKYTVTEADLKAPSDDDAIKNTVTAIASDGTEGYGETEYLKIGEQRPDFTVAKAIIGNGSAEGGRYAAGEAIHYQITVTNTGNTTLRNIVVKDKMTGATGEISEISANATWRKEMGSFIINEPIPVGGKAEITYDYVVRSEDAGNRIRNVATGKPWSDVVTEVEVEKKELTVNKYIANSPANGTAYTMGEEILFGVTVTNTGNVSLSDITVTDQMNATGQAVPVAVNEDGEIEALNSNHTIDSLNAGQSVTVYYSYTVQEDDIGRTDISNAVTANGSGTEGTDKIPIENIDRLYTLTIHYLYSADGTTAAADYTVQLPAGKDYAVYSPEIEGYNSSVPFITGTMPERDLEFIVYYTVPTTPGGGGGGGTPDTPEPPTPPTPPTEPEPVVPIIPGPVPAGVIPVVVPTDPALAAIDDEAVPLQGALIDVDDDGNVTITPIEEEEVPLAGGTVDEHTCCILHFLLMLAAMIVYSCYTSSMKKRQKKLAELKDQLANETLKRQLGITDGKQAKM